MDKDTQQFHEVYEGHSKDSKDAVLTEINKNDQPMDFDGSKLGLETHLYAMDGLPPIRMMVKRGRADNKISLETMIFSVVSYPNLLPIENYSSRGHGWLIVPCIDGSLKGWMNSQNGLAMYQGDGQKKELSPQFRAMLIDLCSLLHKLSQKYFFPKRFGIWDCYVKLVSNAPKIQVLLTDVEKRSSKTGVRAMAEKMQDFMNDCCQALHIELSDISKNFIRYICDAAVVGYVETDIRVPLDAFLENYPHNWSLNQKECYLFNIVSGHHIPWHAIRSRINTRINTSEAIDWPRNNDDSVVQELVDINGLGGLWQKNVEYPFEYIQQCRNCLKHFNRLPNANQQALGGSAQRLLERMEQWDPEIWTKLYHIYGPLVYSK